MWLVELMLISLVGGTFVAFGLRAWDRWQEKTVALFKSRDTK